MHSTVQDFLFNTDPAYQTRIVPWQSIFLLVDLEEPLKYKLSNSWVIMRVLCEDKTGYVVIQKSDVQNLIKLA
jgi:hypothetical protein